MSVPSCCAGPWEEPVLKGCWACMHGCIFCAVCDSNRRHAAAQREREATSGNRCIRWLSQRSGLDCAPCLHAQQGHEAKDSSFRVGKG